MDAYESGFDRLNRVWPELVEVQYRGQPEMIAANGTMHRARQVLAEMVDGDGSFELGYPDNPDHVALAAIIEAAVSLCGVNRMAAVRLLKVAIAEIETNDLSWKPLQGA